MDWAMKYIPLAQREEQTSWFGKRGLSLHVSVANLKVHPTLIPPGELAGAKIDYYTCTYIHLPENTNKQNGQAVIALLVHLLKVIQSEVPWISKAIIRPDNAGCYHCSELIYAVPLVSRRFGMKNTRWVTRAAKWQGPCRSHGGNY